MRKILLKEIAEKAEVSVRTVLRVLNGEEHVRTSTRRHVSAVLSRYGYLLRQGSRREKLLVYGRKNNPMIELLLKGLFQEEYEVRRLSYSDSPKVQREAFENADIAVLFSNPMESDMERIREWNPDVFRIVCSYGYVHDAELLITPNNQGIGSFAADYLCGEMGYRTVFAILPETGIDFAERIKAFAGQVLIQYPSVELKVFPSLLSEETFDTFFREFPFRGAGVFIPGCVLTRNFVLAAERHNVRIPDDIGLISCDNPEHYMTGERRTGWKFPSFIEFHEEQVVEWVLYYLKYRPRTILTPAVTYLPFTLVENNSTIKHWKGL